MKRRSIAAAAAAAATSIALFALSGAARADIAPNGVDSCEVLPEGARCYERGVVPGVCVVVDKETKSKSCRATGATKAPADATTAAPSASASASAEPPARAAPASGGGCSMVLTAADRSGRSSEVSIGALLAVALFGAAFAGRVRRRR